ncbi:thioredoxin-disulfide reductase [Candidatus Gottesmanbacteria bacterium RIFCSPLOWO2_01_FULL_40_10]|uniref:Thioredoxin reductase n=1 Tax=Candidatus Gottesmanbacteria bacterium RIFCSPHIGHO2_01_FULL_40_15 TaxID=1798376 RepID=A0A1F5Z3S1_9BACT|nr:MAG: thioredoxin-disulfide reductase [Candidatus Gottesmanbacteria bacterium RIFCSPHIGHO2_01_FULL_40_15]OGG22860.1 MAG: thioredoxin-disulfide reductase [Candidatus Gottesmanbacteria bacterium RIFCSPLOWO2_01_FULL_40_10]
MYDVIILGSGPAGLTAGIYAIRAGRKTLLIAGSRWGGQLMLTTLVENYPGFVEGIEGPELMVNMRNQTERLGVEILNSDVTEADFNKKPFEVKSDGKIFKGKSVIIATGADSIWLEAPGELQLRGKGVSTCATCDAFFFRDKDVIVVGGGDSAMEEALVLSQVTKSVTIIHRRNAFRASIAMQDRVFKEIKIKVKWNTELIKYNGTAKLESVILKNSKSGKEEVKKIDGVFIAIGHKPNTGIFKGIDLDEKGYVVRKVTKDEKGLLKFRSSTSVEGVFTGGDVHDYRYRQAVTAAGFGCMAALDADKWLMEQEK